MTQLSKVIRNLMLEFRLVLVFYLQLIPINSQHLQDLQLDFYKKGLRVCEEGIYADWLELSLIMS
ncbi:hypothetical protein [Bartonella sp. AA2SXKL]|uniref:hypothetical protein n=1 Tax=Bartonella sp. AA2SXKL TaxID=3243432 RepID=UPI0035CF2B5B